MNEAKAPPVLAKMPKKPKGAKWAELPRITDRLKHELDGRGYIKPGFNHIYIIPVDGGAIRKITSGDYQHRGSLSWSANQKLIYFSGNRKENWEYDFRNSEIYSVNIQTNEIKALTTKNGPDSNPVVSPNGKYIAYTGYADKVQTYQVRQMYIMNTDGSNKRVISESLDRSVKNLIWNAKSSGVYFSYDNHGNSKVAHISLAGKVEKLADNMGGTSIGRPYPGGSFSVSNKGTIAFTQTTPEYPSELAVINPKTKNSLKITSLNKALLEYRNLGKVEEVWYTSSFDQRNLQGWVVYPPNYDASKKYPFDCRESWRTYFKLWRPIFCRNATLCFRRIYCFLPKPKRKYKLRRRICQPSV